LSAEVELHKSRSERAEYEQQQLEKQLRMHEQLEKDHSASRSEVYQLRRKVSGLEAQIEGAMVQAEAMRSERIERDRHVAALEAKLAALARDFSIADSEAAEAEGLAQKAVEARQRAEGRGQHVNIQLMQALDERDRLSQTMAGLQTEQAAEVRQLQAELLERDAEREQMDADAMVPFAPALAGAAPGPQISQCIAFTGQQGGNSLARADCARADHAEHAVEGPRERLARRHHRGVDG
jgi:hypothetical protein